jgi:hypothetical protein
MRNIDHEKNTYLTDLSGMQSYYTVPGKKIDNLVQKFYQLTILTDTEMVMVVRIIYSLELLLDYLYFFNERKRIKRQYNLQFNFK